MKLLRQISMLTAALVTVASPAHAQTECVVTSTYSGRWNRVELNCGGTPTSAPRVAVVQAEALRACPLLVGDRVAVAYQNNDTARQPQVTAVQTRGDGGPSSGDWCARAFPPGRYVGPCLLEEDPPWNQRADTVGAQWRRRSVATWLRDTDDNRQSVGPTGCGPVELQAGVYRIHVEESVRSGIMRPGPTWAMDRQVFADESTTTNRYDGGIYIDGELARVDSVMDLTPLVRGWGITPTDAVVETPEVALPGETTVEAPAWVPCGEMRDSLVDVLDEGPAPEFRITPQQRDTIINTLTVAQQNEVRQIGRLLGQGSMFPALQPGWEYLVAQLGGRNVPVDINALVQQVLSIAYEEATADLRAYADRVRAFMEYRAAVREHVRQMRDFKAHFVSSGDSSAQWTDFRPGPRITAVAGRDDPPVATTKSPEEHADLLALWEDAFRSKCDDAQLANIEMQNMLQRQQQTMQTISKTSKMLHDTAMAIIRKVGDAP